MQGTPDEAAKLMKPYAPEKMTATAVSTHVNSVWNDVPECIEPLNAPSGIIPPDPAAAVGRCLARTMC